MKKVLIILICLLIMPVCLLAEETGLLSDTGIVNELPGLTYDASTSTLTMDGFNARGFYMQGNGEDLIVKVVGENVINGGNQVIYCPVPCGDISVDSAVYLGADFENFKSITFIGNTDSVIKFVNYEYGLNFYNISEKVTFKNINISSEGSCKTAILGSNSIFEYVFDNINFDLRYEDVRGSSFSFLQTENNITVTNSHIYSEHRGYIFASSGNITITNSTFDLVESGLASGIVDLNGSIVNADNSYLFYGDVSLNNNVMVIKNESVGIGADNLSIRNGTFSFENVNFPFIAYKGIELGPSFNKKYKIINYDTGYDYREKEFSISETSEGTCADYADFYSNIFSGNELIGTAKISFDANGGSGTMNSLTFPFEEETQIPKNEFIAPSGKKFKGWSLTKTGNVIDELKFVDDITLYAVWDDIPVEKTEEPTKETKEEEKKEKENPNTGTVIKITSLLGMIVVGGYILYTTSKNTKFN